VIVTRNDYEVQSDVQRAIDPETQSFGEFRLVARRHKEGRFHNRTIAMFSTGGIRCEKSQPILSRVRGAGTCSHLPRAGSSNTLKKSAEQSSWQGALRWFFDNRVSVWATGEEGPAYAVHGCRARSSEAHKPKRVTRQASVVRLRSIQTLTPTKARSRRTPKPDFALASHAAKAPPRDWDHARPALFPSAGLSMWA